MTLNDQQSHPTLTHLHLPFSFFIWLLFYFNEGKGRATVSMTQTADAAFSSPLINPTLQPTLQTHTAYTLRSCHVFLARFVHLPGGHSHSLLSYQNMWLSPNGKQKPFNKKLNIMENNLLSTSAQRDE